MTRKRTPSGSSAVKAFFGNAWPLVEHVVQMTAVFVVILACLFVARKVVPLLFPPGEFLSATLHAVDTYAALLGTIGYTVWLTLDMFGLLMRRVRQAIREKNDERSEP